MQRRGLRRDVDAGGPEAPFLTLKQTAAFHAAVGAKSYVLASLRAQSFPKLPRVGSVDPVDSLRQIFASLKAFGDSVGISLAVVVNSLTASAAGVFSVTSEGLWRLVSDGPAWIWENREELAGATAVAAPIYILTTSSSDSDQSNKYATSTGLQSKDQTTNNDAS